MYYTKTGIGETMVRLPNGADEKPLFWIGSSLKDLKKLPATVQDDLGAALTVRFKDAV